VRVEMHQFQTAVPPLRTPGAPQYGIGTPIQTMEFKKASMMPASRQPGRAIPVAHSVAPVPAPTQQATVNTKMQPQLQHLPRFQPPSFEGLNGLLPCPDSPGSTPRGSEEGSMEEEPLESLGASEPRQTEASLEAIEKSREKDDQREKAGPFAVGSFVEYKSRSSGHWILAKVEAYDESSTSYRLDVQPHAHPDRVRHRQGRSGGEASQDPETAARRRERNAARELDAGRDRDAGLERDGRHSGAGRDPAANRDREPAREVEAFREREPLRERDAGYNMGQEPGVARADCDLGHDGGHQKLMDSLGQAPTTLPVPFSTISAADNVQQIEASSATDSLSPDLNNIGAGRLPDESQEVDGNLSGRLMVELEMVRQQVTQLQADKRALEDRLNQEVALKGRYFDDLCKCQDQLQRNRGTPR